MKNLIWSLAFLSMLTNFCSSRAQTPSPVYPAHCWLYPDSYNQDSQVELMIYVIGLNHRTNYRKGDVPEDGVISQGVNELANFIHGDYKNADNIMILSSSFVPTCGTINNGHCLVEALNNKYHDKKFTITEVAWHSTVTTPDNWGTIGIITGSKWRVSNVERLPILSENVVFKAYIQDNTNPNIKFKVYVMHTGDNDLALDWIKPSAANAFYSASVGDMPPIFAGDFNTPIGVGHKAAFHDVAPNFYQYIGNYLDWPNYVVSCVPQAGKDPTEFHLQQGNKMHLFFGKKGGQEYSYECSSGTWEGIRLSYSVNSDGGFISEPGFGETRTHGILIPHISHNVIGMGFVFTHDPEYNVPVGKEDEYTCKDGRILQKPTPPDKCLNCKEPRECINNVCKCTGKMKYCSDHNTCTLHGCDDHKKSEKEQ